MTIAAPPDMKQVLRPELLNNSNMCLIKPRAVLEHLRMAADM